MADVADLAQDIIEADLDRALAGRRAKATAAGTGPETTTGVCVDCDEPIPPARLAANPDAARCIDCQSGFENCRR